MSRYGFRVYQQRSSERAAPEPTHAGISHAFKRFRLATLRGLNDPEASCEPVGETTQSDEVRVIIVTTASLEATTSAVRLACQEAKLLAELRFVTS